MIKFNTPDERDFWKETVLAMINRKTLYEGRIYPSQIAEDADLFLSEYRKRSEVEKPNIVETSCACGGQGCPTC